MNYKKICTLLLTVCMTAGVVAQTDSTSKYSNNGRHKGLDFNFSTGYHAGVGDFKKGGSIPFEMGLGKQFSSNLYAGIGSGIWLGTKGVKPMIPITADAKLMLPLHSTPIKPIFTVRLGYLLNTASDIEGESHEYGGITYETESYEMPDYIMMQIMPGVQLPVSKTTDFMLSAGYTHAFSTKGGGGGGYFTVKLGFNFHKNPNKIKLGPKREKVDTRDKGLQFSLEGNGIFSEGEFGSGGNLVCTYKLNPHFSVGGGIGYALFSPFGSGIISGGDREYAEGEDIQVLTFNNSNNSYREETYGYYGDVSAINLFARGVYRLSNRRFSPFASLDAGISLFSYDQSILAGYDNIVGMPSKVAPFVSPAIGLSIRTTKNSYLELKGGYTFNTGIRAKKGYKRMDYETTYVSTSGKNLSHAFVSLGFTHTFGKRGKRLR